ncbi:DnaJ-domain-containing protein [Laetiporus sulphureus 93-53]|uniref:DnaJ-domain-containing protein n=1 Tax=Laetiporus sulphureus 93-53 TaxID=1314785 RepID=A0A165BSH2_9APHY|nr:DnaJ-domain-containing protein [Laetiporus sulphureus 93-53]KZT01570.1 DnaJ-domain-containing protein [Laetiporus sulphureus 93-53]
MNFSTLNTFNHSIISGPARYTRRGFSSTSFCRHEGHYGTLSVPKDASKSQIKSSFYKLSKMYHPDVTQDPEAREKFHAVSEAYAVLGDDRRRRAYDRSLAVPSTVTHAKSSSHSSPYSHWSSEGRRRGATYAWEHSRRPGAGNYRPPPGYQTGYSHPAGSQFRPQSQHYDPFLSPHVRRATQKKSAAEEEHDRIQHESGFWRTMQVIGIIMAIATVGGGFTANVSLVHL